MLTTLQWLLVHYLNQSLQLLPETNSSSSIIYGLKQNTTLQIPLLFSYLPPDDQLASELLKGIHENSMELLAHNVRSRSLKPDGLELSTV